jgi:hypothetical protein
MDLVVQGIEPSKNGQPNVIEENSEENWEGMKGR